MLRMCVYMHSRFIKNHRIWILEDGPLISKMVLSHPWRATTRRAAPSSRIFLVVRCLMSGHN
jgi:hypothetical protein